MHYSMVKPHCLNFRLKIAAIVWGVGICRSFTVFERLQVMYSSIFELSHKKMELFVV